MVSDLLNSVGVLIGQDKAILPLRLHGCFHNVFQTEAVICESVGVTFSGGVRACYAPGSRVEMCSVLTGQSAKSGDAKGCLLSRENPAYDKVGRAINTDRLFDRVTQCALAIWSTRARYGCVCKLDNKCEILNPEGVDSCSRDRAENASVDLADWNELSERTLCGKMLVRSDGNRRDHKSVNSKAISGE